MRVNKVRWNKIIEVIREKEKKWKEQENCRSDENV